MRAFLFINAGVRYLEMELHYEIKPDNLKVLKIEQIALNKDKFGALTFDKTFPMLNELRKILVEFEELGYINQLTPEEVGEVDGIKNRLLGYIQRINDLNPATDAGWNINLRSALENEIESFYRSSIRQLRNNLVFLRQEMALKSSDQQTIAEEQKAANQARKQAEETLAELKGKLEKLNEREQQIESTSGKIGAKVLGIHFDIETERYQRSADYWLRGAIISYIILIVFVLAGIIYYTFIKEGGWAKVIWQEGAAKITLFAVIWYAVSFLVRNYNVNSHLAAVNRHRAAVARTLEDFLVGSPTRQSEMLKNATEAMFKHAPVGFISKAEKDSNNPIFEIANKITGSKTE